MLTTLKVRPRREKMFGEGRVLPLDRNAKARIMTLARALTHRTEKGKHYGVITDKFLRVLDALVWGFHNAMTGRCFPSYEAIAARADCNRSTVYAAIHALEAAGILTWVNRIVRVKEWEWCDLFGRARTRTRVVRTSNQYVLIDPQVKNSPETGGVFSKSEFQTGTACHLSILEAARVPQSKLDPANPLHRALIKLGKLLESEKGAAPDGAAKSLPT